MRSRRQTTPGTVSQNPPRRQFFRPHSPVGGQNFHKTKPLSPTSDEFEMDTAQNTSGETLAPPGPAPPSSIPATKEFFRALERERGQTLLSPAKFSAIKKR